MGGTYINTEEGSGKEQAKQSVRKGGLSKGVRNPMGRRLNWNDEWNEKEGLAVRELSIGLATVPDRCVGSGSGSEPNRHQIHSLGCQ